MVNKNEKFSTALTQDLTKVVMAGMELGDVVDTHFDELYDHYTNNGEMPYGVAKARDGDPNQWIFNQLEQELDDYE